MICICNDMDMKTIAACIKAHGWHNVAEMIGNSECEIRITSYNVCYTKLLRDMPRYLLPLLAAAALHAGMTDFHTLSEAKAAYDAGDYAEASALYGGLQTKNDAARYDYGNALYKQKKFV